MLGELSKVSEWCNNNSISESRSYYLGGEKREELQDQLLKGKKGRCSPSVESRISLISTLVAVDATPSKVEPVNSRTATQRQPAKVPSQRIIAFDDYKLRLRRPKKRCKG